MRPNRIFRSPLTAPAILGLLLAAMPALAHEPGHGHGAGSATPATGTLEARGAVPAAGPDLELRRASVRHLDDLDLLVFELQVAGRAGGTVPTAAGRLDGAPVLGYVFPTTLKPRDVWFGDVEGTVALAVTAHPDFDDTPLWDEDGNGDFADDGVVWHSHWVVLGPDARVPGGLAVVEMPAEQAAANLPPTNPGMPMYMDSPGFAIVTRDNTLRVLVPVQRVRGRTDFRFDAVAAFMEVDTRGTGPMLGVYEVYGVLSGDLSLPFSVSAER